VTRKSKPQRFVSDSKPPFLSRCRSNPDRRGIVADSHSDEEDCEVIERGAMTEEEMDDVEVLRTQRALAVVMEARYLPGRDFMDLLQDAMGLRCPRDIPFVRLKGEMDRLLAEYVVGRASENEFSIRLNELISDIEHSKKLTNHERLRLQADVVDIAEVHVAILVAIRHDPQVEVAETFSLRTVAVQGEDAFRAIPK